MVRSKDRATVGSNNPMKAIEIGLEEHLSRLCDPMGNPPNPNTPNPTLKNTLNPHLLSSIACMPTVVSTTCVCALP